MKFINLVLPFAMLSLFGPTAVLIQDNAGPITYSYDEEAIYRFQPYFSNNITAEKVYARTVEQDGKVAYEYIYYWPYQNGTFKFDSHNHDYEWVVIYNPVGKTQVNYDRWHYLIDRKEADNDELTFHTSHVLLEPNRIYRYFKPANYITTGNISEQQNQSIQKLNDTVLSQAEERVGLDKSLMDDPFEWKDGGLFGRRTAWASAWRGFWAWSDYKLDFLNLEDEGSLAYKIA